MSRQDELKQLITINNRRLQFLKQQEAFQGSLVDPRIPMEIEDIESKIARLQRELKTLENNCLTEETRRDLSGLTENTERKQRVQIYISGDFSSLSPDRKFAAIDAFAAVIGIRRDAIEVYSVQPGSIVFDLGVPYQAVQRLRSLLKSNNQQLRLLEVKKGIIEVEKVIIEGEPGQTEEWVVKEGEFELVPPVRLWKMIIAVVITLIALFAIFLWLTNNAATNHPPSIQSLIASPTTLTVGQQAMLTVIATDVDGDSLAYYWEAQKGSVPGGAQSETITYTAPPNSGLDTVKVIITDGNTTVTQEIRLSILAEQ